MMKKRNPAFIAELLLLFIALLFVIVVITKTCMAARSRSIYAGDLTDAVILARNTAEITLSAEDMEEAAAYLKEMDGVTSLTETENAIELETARAGRSGKESFRVTVSFAEDKAGAGHFRESEILVFRGDEKEPLYTLTTGNYRTEAEHAS